MKKGQPAFYILGILLFTLTLRFTLKKVEEAIIKGENVLTVNLGFKIGWIIVLSILSILTLVFAILDDKKIIWGEIRGFLGWAIEIFVSVMAVYIIVLVPHFKEWFNLLIILIFLALFILFKRLSEK